MELMCRFCGKNVTSKDELTSILNREDNKYSDEIHLEQKIIACLPVNIHENDYAPTQICLKCCKKTNETYEFIEEILAMQDYFNRKFKESQNTTASLINEKSGLSAEHNATTETFLKEDCDIHQNKALHRTEVETANNNNGLTKNSTNKNIVSDVLKRLSTLGKHITISRVKHKDTAAAESPEPMESEQISNADNNEFENGLSDEALEDTDDEYTPAMSPQKVESPSRPRVSRTRKKLHSSKVTVVKMEAPPVYICMMCKEKFASFEPLKDHMKNSKKCKQVQLKCEICNKICDTKKSLYQHSLVHRDKPTLVCEQCGKTFTNRFNLENHKSSKHGEYVEENGSIYRCKVCDDQFKNRKDLYDHISNHSKAPVFLLCDTCGKNFSSPETLRSHIRIHQNVRPFACTFCPKRFRSRLQLTQHLHVHTGIKNFLCQLCNKAFAKKDSLVAHSRMHTGETPYQCSECPERFASLNKRKTHMKMHYLQGSADDADGADGADAADAADAADDAEAAECIDAAESVDAIETFCHEESASSYITYSTTYIDSDNILVFEDPGEQVIHIEDIMNKSALSALE